jgi:hypothetical protein
MKNKLSFFIILIISGTFPIMGLAILLSIIELILDKNLIGGLLSIFWLENPLARILFITITLLASGLLFSVVFKKMFNDILETTGNK